ncbi:MAG: hypothetical protein ACRDSP_22935 [Pseudonocardiaceae bacterium]
MIGATVGTMIARGEAEPAIMQREDERTRMVTVGKRTDDGTQCTLLAVLEAGGTWCMYPHGAATLGVRVSAAEAQRLARVILGGTS